MFGGAVGPGEVAGWITLAVLVYGLVVFRRGGGGTALHTLEAANRILEERVRELETQAHADAGKIAELTASRDWTVAIEPLVETVHMAAREEDRIHGQILAEIRALAATIGGRRETDERPLS